MFTEKFDRQIRLKRFGAEAQQKLADAKVLVVGVGGLGCPALLYIAAAGVGTIGIADFDSIERSNLHRQILFGEGDIGLMKADEAKKKLEIMHPQTTFTCIAEHINNQNALQHFSKFDLIVDGTDNFETRYLINDACVLMNKPLVYGSLFEYEGQVSVFNHADEDGIKAHYRHVFPTPPGIGEVPTCNEAGVLGVLAGIIGTLMAAEAIKVISQTGQSLANYLLSLNIRTNRQEVIRILQKEGKTLLPNMPANLEEFKAMDYTAICKWDEHVAEIDYDQLISWIAEGNIRLVDIREPEEEPKISVWPVEEIPMHRLDALYYTETENKKWVLICRTGRRSHKTALRLRQENPEIAVYSLQGGIQKWPQLINVSYAN